MSIFGNKKRTDFFNDLKKVNFKIVNDFKNTLEQTKNEAEKILTAITNWEKNKKHTEKDKNDNYLKSDSQKYLKEIKKACESIKNAQDNNIIFLLSKLKNELKKAYEAKFGLFTFGAVLDNKKNKKELKRISDDIDNLIKNLPTIKIGLHRELSQEAAQKVMEKKKQKEAKRKDDQNDPGIFKGLPNGEVYCYLNTALQNLYHNSSFRSKVLGFKIKNEKDIKNDIKGNITPDMKKQIKEDLKQDIEFDTSGNIKKDIKNYIKLTGNIIYENSTTQKIKWKGYDIIIFATQFFFKYLDGKIKDDKFNKDREKMALLLRYAGVIESSHTIQKAIENACIRAMRTKPRVEKIYNDNLDSSANEQINKLVSRWGVVCQNDIEALNMATAEFILNKLYKEQKIHDAIINLQDDDFYSNDSAPLEVTHKLFSQWENKESIYTKDNIELYKKSGFNVQNIGTTRKQLLRLLRIPKYSKNSKILSIDSNITLNADDIKKDLVSCIEHAINSKRKQGQNTPKYRLPLKENKFEVTFSDREGGRRSGFTAEEEIDLAQLVKTNKLIIFSNGKELDKNKTKFKLISATIGTGSHFYLYVKKSSTWHCLNDSSHTTTSWDKIKNNISTQCETLTYELI